MTFSIAEIARVLGAEFVGQGALKVKGASEPARAMPDDLALAMDASYVDDLQKGQAVTAVLWPGADWQGLGLRAAIFVDRPRFAMAGITDTFAQAPEVEPGIHPMALVHARALMGRQGSTGLVRNTSLRPARIARRGEGATR